MFAWLLGIIFTGFSHFSVFFLKLKMNWLGKLEHFTTNFEYLPKLPKDPRLTQSCIVGLVMKVQQISIIYPSYQTILR